jgi:hypothetical protein
LAYSWNWRWRRHIPPKRRLTFSELHGVTAHQTELFGLLGVTRFFQYRCLVRTVGSELRVWKSSFLPLLHNRNASQRRRLLSLGSSLNLVWLRSTSFGETYRVLLYGRRENQANGHQEEGTASRT